MKVILITGSAPPQHCGVGDYTYHLGKELSKVHDVTIITSHGAKAVSEPKFKVLPIIENWGARRSFWMLKKLREIKPDILHIQYPTQGYTGWLAYFFQKSAGRTSSEKYMRLIRLLVRSDHQNTYAFRDRPAVIRITHPPHPLFGQALKVIQPRREWDETHWVAQLPDGSHIQLPSSWTDHPVGQVPIERIRVGGRATPDALRNLISLLRTLVAPACTPHAWTHVPSKGGQHEQATPFVRATVSNLGPPDLALDGSRQTPPDPLHDCRDGESFPPPKGAPGKGGN